ncbi:MAG: hypothetical protein EOS51_27270 [Mesorhizobium sp.]|nr:MULTISPECIES: hypothetical protein [unclassified Mesorhizobium]RWC07588.1 MAG: hypothetical protein EOS51_27270 [Mesorhizobium sp.]TGT93867.1 hypothetical protein EN807_26830 [Mesorhizobium sp. M5C.F.Ca.ET.164.01.1.1]
MSSLSSLHSDTTPTFQQAPKFLRREEAAAHVRERWGIPCAVAWLAKLATVGGGPLFRKAGRFPIYATSDLDDWAKSRISEPVRSTSELDALRSLKP